MPYFIHKTTSKHVKILLASATLVGSGVYLSACTAPVMVGMAASGAYIGLQERTAEQIAKDTKVKVHIMDRLTSTNYKYITDIGVTVFEGDVLLTGIVPSREEGEKVLEVVQKTPDVTRIYNEVFVGADYSAKQKGQDIWIATQIKGRLVGNRQAFPINYSIDVVNGHVYIIGYVVSEEEHDHVVHILRTTKGVTEVHDYLRLSPTGEDPRKVNALKSNLRSSPAPVLPDDPYGN